MEKAKVDATSDLLLLATDCFHDLIAMKDNYVGKLTDNPVQRLVSVPPILMHHRVCEPDFKGMLFIPREAKKSGVDGASDWNNDSYYNIARIKLLFVNYNTLFEMWKTRNQLAMPFFEELVSTISSTPESKICLDTMFDLLGYQRVIQLIQLNEDILSMTDDLLVDFARLLNELPEISEQFIEKKVIDKHGGVIRSSVSIEVKEKFLTKVSVNKKILNDILHGHFT